MSAGLLKQSGLGVQPKVVKVFLQIVGHVCSDPTPHTLLSTVEIRPPESVHACIRRLLNMHHW